MCWTERKRKNITPCAEVGKPAPSGFAVFRALKSPDWWNTCDGRVLSKNGASRVEGKNSVLVQPSHYATVRGPGGYCQFLAFPTEGILICCNVFQDIAPFSQGGR